MRCFKRIKPIQNYLMARLNKHCELNHGNWVKELSLILGKSLVVILTIISYHIPSELYSSALFPLHDQPHSPLSSLLTSPSLSKLIHPSNINKKLSY